MSNTQKTVVTCPSCGQRNSASAELLDRTNCGKCHEPLTPAQQQTKIPIGEVFRQLGLSEHQQNWLRSRLRVSEQFPQFGGWFTFDVHSCAAEVKDLFSRGLIQHHQYGDSTRVQVSEESIRLAFARQQKQKEQTQTKVNDVDSSSGVVYLIKAGPHHKIGKTVNLDARFARLKIQLPYKPKLIHSIKTNTKGVGIVCV